MKAFFLVLFLIFTGCGYKPASKIAKTVLGEKVFVDVSISIKDPKNSVLIKDALKTALINRLNIKITSKQETQTHIYTKLKSVSFIPIIYDEDGYVTAYKTKVVLSLDTIFKDKTRKEIIVSGEYDFPIEANSVISDTKRFEAIKNGSQDALDEFIAFISVRGLKNVNNQ